MPKQNGRKHKRENNLTPWPPGTSGNKKGRPPGPSVTTILAEVIEKRIYNKDLMRILSEKFPELFTNKKGNPIKGKKIIELLMIALAGKGLAGDRRSIKDIMERIDGKPAQAIDMTSGGRPIDSRILFHFPENGRRRK